MTMDRLFRKYSGTLALYFVYIALFNPISAQEMDLRSSNATKRDIGGNATLDCMVSPSSANLTWNFKEKRLEAGDRITLSNKTDTSRTEKDYKFLSVTITNLTREDAGVYTCIATYEETTKPVSTVLDLSFNGSFIAVEKNLEVRVNATEKNVTLTCVFELYNDPETVIWTKEGTDETYTANATRISQKRVLSNFDIDFSAVSEEDKPIKNGTYLCSVIDPVSNNNLTGYVHLYVYAPPEIVNITAIGINTTEIYLKWNVSIHNSKVINYVLTYRGEKTDYTYYSEKVTTNMTSVVMKNLKNNTKYWIKLQVVTQHGDVTKTFGPVSTLDEEPVFVPDISINGFSATSVTIGWAPPPPKIEHLIHYYLLEARKKDGGAPRKAYHSKDSRNLPYMFDNLEPHSTYLFKVCAGQDFTGKCGNWSEELEAATLDGIPGKPTNVAANCTNSQMYLWWDPPAKPNAEIKGYSMEVFGVATYNDRSGVEKKDTWGPLSRFKSNDSKIARFDDLQPNTHYTVKLSAMTRTRRRGEEATANCTTLEAPPDQPPRPRWRKIFEDDKYLFKVYLPKVSERNGPICCYRVHMVRMLPGQDVKDMKHQKQLPIIQYDEAHAEQPLLGAYITDIFTNDIFPAEGEFKMGDGFSFYNRSDAVLNKPQCARCNRQPKRAEPTPRPTAATTTASNDVDVDDIVTGDPVDDEGGKQRRSVDVERLKEFVTVMRAEENKDEISVKDGPLDNMANYTLFIELIPGTVTDEPMFSDYINPLMPAPSPVAPAPATSLEIALQATCAVAALVLITMIIFCVMQTRKSRKMQPHARPLEMNSIGSFFRNMVNQIGGRQQLISSTPPDMPPIAKEDLAQAYMERHADSDYGFQKEFEQLQTLSDCFADRTTHASEARENQPKNRYPDIKAYDQTRVRLSQIDGITGSDYINANYVMGYKERKKFICAQGPTDTTVNDFWRMIWEHGLELIVMLTNLEEYSKVKCSKYWPDDVRGARAFGAITVQHVSEKRYSDYIVRELRITKQPTNADGQPIVENNGVAKRNGDIKEPSESAPTSPREVKETGESRIVRQYHFLMWKDFAAPEHPYSILKFIKRVNEAWSNMVGRPVVVHCSAGVGRTGTLVALDCLLEQLNATGQVAVFNTIAELRRQRNFLVQSQKQYVFVYRALVEYAHYGDTEIPANRLKSCIDRLRNTPEGADKCLIQLEFEKMIDSPVSEPVKSCAAGVSDELRARNRNMDCLPYDRNRVMLTPIPGRDFSTYINASFVETYDNTEGYIITQDPLPNTIFDFWRMVSEQSVATIVMLSELGEGKCPRYWDDSTAQYEHITVQYDESESCPYYTRRQFRVTNNKTGHVTSVRQLQYHGWPTSPGSVPEVTRGLAELADASSPAVECGTPMVVHCNTGTERSALFVALCILICQLRTERRVDVNAVARKVRSQRAHTIDTFSQYEFLHRAILNYAELHNLLEDS